MVNLKSWTIVIFVLNSHISCRTLQHLKKKKKLTKTRCLAVILSQICPLFREFVSNTQDNLITSGRLKSISLCDFLPFCAAKCTIENLNVAKISRIFFALMVTFYIRGTKFMMLSCRKFSADGNFFYFGL